MSESTEDLRRLQCAFINPFLDRNQLKNSMAASPAVNHWLSEFSHNIKNRTADYRILGHIPDRMFPKGSLYVKGRTQTVETIPVHNTGYFNIPVLRNHSLSFGYRSALQRHFNHKETILLFTYNLQPGILKAVTAFKAKNKNVTWIAFIGDLPDHTFKWCVEEFVDNITSFAFFSQDSFEKCPLPRKILLEGGFTPAFSPLKPKPGFKKFFYAGGADEISGLDYLVQEFKETKDTELQLILCGKAYPAEILRKIQSDDRIEYKGFLDDTDLFNVMDDCDFFINPRPTQLSASNSTFPSKLFLYFKTGKPVLSTLTKGMPPEYGHFLETFSFEKGSLSKKIEDLSSLPAEEYNSHCFNLRKALRAKTWDAQISKMEHFTRLIDK